MHNNEKIAVWVLAIANPIICASVTYLMWYEMERMKFRYALRAATTMFVAYAVFIALSVAFG